MKSGPRGRVNVRPEPDHRTLIGGSTMADEDATTLRCVRAPACHPERKLHARGLCKRCYYATAAQKAKRAAREADPARKIARALYHAAHYRRPGTKAARAIARSTPKRKAVKAAYDAAYYAARRKADLCYRLRTKLRVRVNCALRNGSRAGSAVADLGCSIEHLKLHLALFWDEGMSWENWGHEPGCWSIDHIKPLSAFDLTVRAQFLEAVHYTNLQPLWHVDNLRKGNGLHAYAACVNGYTIKSTCTSSGALSVPGCVTSLRKSPNDVGPPTVTFG
jgi:hypothetical protein